MRARLFARSVELSGQCAVQNVVDQSRFSRARHARHHRHDPERKCDVEILQIIFARAQNRDRLAVRLPAFVAASRSALGRKCRRRSAMRRACMISSGVPLRHQFAAVAAGAGTEVDHVIGAANGFFVMLDHQHRIAQIAQLFQRQQQSVDCRDGADRSTARRGRTERRAASNRSASPGGCVALRLRKASPPSGRARCSPGRPRSETAAARQFHERCVRRSFPRGLQA